MSSHGCVVPASPSGLSLIGSAAWFGRSCTKACDLSSKAVNRIPGPRKKRAQMLARALRKLGYEVTITPRNHRRERNANLAENFRGSVMI